MKHSLMDSLEEIRLLIEAVSRGEYCCLRHGLPYITPGLLAEQAFCEQRLHLRLNRGDANTPSPGRARKLLEILLEAKKRITSDEVEKGVVASFPLAAVVEEVPLLGRPPAVAIRKGCVKSIILAKESRRLRLYPSDEVKLAAYATLLSLSRLSCSDTVPAAIIVAQKPLGITEALNLIDPYSPRPFQGEGYRVIVRLYDRATAASLLAPLLAYWKGLREPQPRPGQWCSSCNYRDTCPAWAKG